MPIHVYRCKSCGHEFDHIKLHMDDKPYCPQCNSSLLERLIGQSNFQLKGDGWAADGYSKSGHSKKCD